MKPSESIVPILALDNQNNIIKFLGTGTFIGEKPFLVTADHVIREWSGKIGIAFMLDLKHIWLANILIRNIDVDLAILEVNNCNFCKGILMVNEKDIVPNKFVICHEYGTTLHIGREIRLSPATRMGNVTRLIDLIDRFGKAGESMLELSFPALRGASGSPILACDNFKLWGIVIANIAYHLLPVQVERIIDEQGQFIEETKFMLPQALAVNVKHLRAIIPN